MKEPTLIPGVIMAIVFSAKINGEVLDPYSDNNYYTGTWIILAHCTRRQEESHERLAALVLGANRTPPDRSPTGSIVDLSCNADPQDSPSFGLVSLSASATCSAVFRSVSPVPRPLWAMLPIPSCLSRF